MILFSSPEDWDTLHPTCLTLGNFDGMHIGHQALLDYARNLALQNNLLLTPVTFIPHPTEVLSPGHSPNNLATRQEKLDLFGDLGITRLMEIPFTPRLAMLSAEEFVAQWLLPLKPACIVIGHDFRFGHGRNGTLATLQKIGASNNFSVIRLEAVLADGFPVSSSRIRQELLSGNIPEVSRLLGRYFALQGIVEHGFKRGRTIDFPTANISPGSRLLPPNGVYATLVAHEGQAYPAVTNIGENPTFNGTKITVESYLLDKKLNLYDKIIKVEFLEKLRSEVKFPSAELLKQQIARDIVHARKVFSHS